MTTGLTYNQYVAELANLAVVEPTDVNFVANLPQCITYAENRIYRDLDLLATVTAASGYSLVAGNRQLTFPLTDFITLQEVNVITPVGISNPNAGTRVSLCPVTKFWLDVTYPSATVTGVPASAARSSPEWKSPTGPPLIERPEPNCVVTSKARIG